MNKYVYTPDENHSRLLCHHNPAYHYDSILSNEHAAAYITNVESEASLSSNEISNKNITKTK